MHSRALPGSSTASLDAMSGISLLRRGLQCPVCRQQAISMSQRLLWSKRHVPVRCSNCASEVRLPSAQFIGALVVGAILAILVAITTNAGYAGIAIVQWTPAIAVAILGRLSSPEAEIARRTRIVWYRSPVLWLAVLIVPIVLSGFF